MATLILFICGESVKITSAIDDVSAKMEIPILVKTLMTELYLQIRVLKATAAKIPWTRRPKLSFNRQFLSLEAMSTAVAREWNLASLCSKSDVETAVENGEDWFIG